MRIALLYDGRSLAAWQRRAIELVAKDHDLVLLIAEGPGPRTRRRMGHALYYALNLAAVRNRLTRRVPFPPDEARAADTLRFTPGSEHGWAVLPDVALDWLATRRVDAVIKFGLNLLRIPSGVPPILSYHHGDPRVYRGRPAGFYELANGEPFMGQVIQIASNEIDAGAVLAFAETRVHRHSYRRTLLEAYVLSPHLLPEALGRLARAETLPFEPKGHNYRLPANAQVARVLTRSVWHGLQRLAYGAFIEKRWRVALVQCDPAADPPAMVAHAEQSSGEWRIPPLLPGYRFYADGFFHARSDDLLVEALNAVTGKGELVRIRGECQTRIASPGRTHVSYPQTVLENGVPYVVPETAACDRPAIFRLDEDSLRKVADLDIDADAIIDPTLVRHDGRIYLFGNRRREGTAILHLWSAPSLFARFDAHPATPVRVSARGSRMAGAVVTHSGQLFRLGQDCRHGYGDGLLCFRIEALSEREYREAFYAEAAFSTVKGPHTLNRHGDSLLFDWYVERFSPLAGIRRLAGKF
ncbi:MAG TPA: hypothetical protein VNR11_14400 [Xanthobacteraceae bacterium]|nr:hypothetical protein [Xanthobacteraceae bacterium]